MLHIHLHIHVHVFAYGSTKPCRFVGKAAGSTLNLEHAAAFKVLSRGCRIPSKNGAEDASPTILSKPTLCSSRVILR